MANDVFILGELKFTNPNDMPSGENDQKSMLQVFENPDDFNRYKRISEKYYKLLEQLINKFLLKDRREIVKTGLSLEFRSLSSDYKDIFYDYKNEHDSIVP